MKLLRIRVRRYKHSISSRYVVEGIRVNGKRARRFFKKKEEAETFAEQKRIEMLNHGQKALSVPDSLRLMAVKSAAKRRLVKILPNLAAWLSPYARSKGQIWNQSESALAI